MSTATHPVTDADRLAFERDGFHIARGLYGADQMLACKTLVKGLLAERAFDDKSGVFVWSCQMLHPTLRALMGDDKVVPLLRRLVGPDIEFLSVKAVFKDGKTTFGSPWHQDWQYWHGATKHSVWIALDDATVANGCLKVVPGSHTKVFEHDHSPSETGFGNRIDDADLANLPKLTVEMKRGDALFFHDLLLHASFPNTSGADRWSFISTYRNAGVIDDCDEGVRSLWAQPMLVSGHSVNGGK